MKFKYIISTYSDRNETPLQSFAIDDAETAIAVGYALANSPSRPPNDYTVHIYGRPKTYTSGVHGWGVAYFRGGDLAQNNRELVNCLEKAKAAEKSTRLKIQEDKAARARKIGFLKKHGWSLGPTGLGNDPEFLSAWSAEKFSEAHARALALGLNSTADQELKAAA